jgi:hypothetical protein
MPEQPTPDNKPIRLRDLLRMYWKTIVAVLGGNFVYYAILYRRLPPRARHRRNQVDLGLVIDFWICLFIYGLLAFRFRLKKKE